MPRERLKLTRPAKKARRRLSLKARRNIERAIESAPEAQDPFPGIPSTLYVGERALQRFEVSELSRTHRHRREVCWRWLVSDKVSLFVVTEMPYSGDPWYIGVIVGRGVRVSTIRCNTPEEAAKLLTATVAEWMVALQALQEHGS